MQIFLALLIVFSNAVLAKDLATLHRERELVPPRFFDKSEYKGYGNQTFGITKVGLQRTNCFGYCPAFLLEFDVDGAVKYEGGVYAKKQGKHSGKIEPYKLHSLLAFINEIEYFELQNVYTYDITDHSSVYTMVTTKSDSKVIKNYANTGPMKLWALEQLIEQLLIEVVWEEIDS